MRLSTTLGPLLLLVLQNSGVFANASEGGLYPPGLQPIINRADTLLSSGQFGDAAKAYSEAIEQSPNDYLLYYKRATSHLSLQRHFAALEDFDKVLSLTSNTFDNAHLQKARIYLKDGNFAQARHSLSLYLKAKKGVRTPDVEELEKDIAEGGRLLEKTEKEHKSQLWTACVESATQALRVASHSHDIRNWRAECSLASGDVESAVGDLTRLSHLLPSSTTLLTHIFRLSYFLTAPSPTSMNTLKQCLHFDPDSKPCLVLHRIVKKFDKAFASLDDLLAKEDWKGILKLLMTPGAKTDLWKKWEEAMKDNLSTANIFPLVPPTLLPLHNHSHKTKKVEIPLPDAEKTSPQRQHLVRALCKTYTHLADLHTSNPDYPAKRTEFCELLLTLSGCDNDVDALVGKAASLLAKQEYEEAVRVLEKAFEQSGRSDAKVHRKLTDAQKALKQSRMKDYYKIVGVDKHADEKTIKKAYRRAAKFAHPDKGGSEQKMAALNEAYEVLSNPELRAQFDAGVDPMDPQSQQGGGHPFAQGFGGGDPFAQFFAQGGHHRGGHGGPGGAWHFQYSN